jgi:hypothetical protein
MSQLTVHDAVGLEDAQLDAILAAHVPPTEDERRTALAARDIDALALKAFALALFDEIDGRHPQNTREPRGVSPARDCVSQGAAVRRHM